MEYNANKLEIAEHKQQQGIAMLAEVESRCEKKHVAFLKDVHLFEKIKDIEAKPYFKDCIAAMLLKVSNLSGLKGSLDPINLMDIVQMILTTCKTLSVEELYKAFQMERYSLYESKTDHFGLFNSEYVGQIIKKYKEWKLKEQREGNFSIQPQNALPEITETQKREILISGINRIFNEYKETKILPEPNNFVFDELYEKGIIKSGEKYAGYYRQVYAEAENRVKKELSQAEITDIITSRNIKDEIEKVQNKTSGKVVAMAKKIMLEKYFDSIISKGIYINDVLKQSENKE